MARPDDDGERPDFDRDWVEGAKRAESDTRRYQASPGPAPAPWRAWSPPERDEPAPPRNDRRSGRAGVLLGVGLAVVVALALWGFSGGGGNSRLSPPASFPNAAPPNPGTTAPVTTAPVTTTAVVPVTTPTTTVPRVLPWAPVTVLPSGGADATQATVFATIRVGACLASTPDLRSITIVSCAGPHTEEVTVVRDLTTVFATTPTYDQIQTLNNQLCPAAARAWTGGADPQYTSGYLWQFQDGVPGQVVRALACTVMLSGQIPFTGTLRRAAT